MFGKVKFSSGVKYLSSLSMRNLYGNTEGKKSEALKIHCDLISSEDYSSVSLLCVGLKFFVFFFLAVFSQLNRSFYFGRNIRPLLDFILAGFKHLEF